MVRGRYLVVQLLYQNAVLSLCEITARGFKISKDPQNFLKWGDFIYRGKLENPGVHARHEKICSRVQCAAKCRGQELCTGFVFSKKQMCATISKNGGELVNGPYDVWDKDL